MLVRLTVQTSYQVIALGRNHCQRESIWRSKT